MQKRYERELSPEELAALPDEAIDTSDIPELDEAFFRNARLVMPEGKRQVTLRIDADVLDWFRARGKGYQSRMNAVLRAYVAAQRQA
jgi:uncharacterized protein (DUF4415 family)